jgi:hypothetical protein
MSPEIEKELHELESFEQKLFDISKKMMGAGSGVFPLDHFAKTAASGFIGNGNLVIGKMVLGIFR